MGERIAVALQEIRLAAQLCPKRCQGGLHLRACIRLGFQPCKAFARIVKIGRTHTQDATPLTLGQEFSGYAAQVASGIARLRIAVKDLYPLAQGGTAVGTGLNSKPKFARAFAKHVARMTRLPFTSAINKFEALASNDAYVFAHGAINSVATGLFKIANDVRLLGNDGRTAVGRIASFGQGGRFLVTLGSRAIRRSARRKLDIPAVVWAGTPVTAYPATILDVSRTGARVEGVSLPVGSELALRFTPPGGDHEFTLRGIVVRQIPTTEHSEIGIAFTMGSEIDLPD